MSAIRLTGVSLVAIMTMSLAGSQPARSNGATFFEEDVGVEYDGTVYFGFVRDQRNLPINDAIVTITVKDKNVQYKTETSPIGIYKNVQVAKDVDPSDVEVSVNVPGYTLVKAVNKTRMLTPGEPVQIDFQMKSQ